MVHTEAGHIKVTVLKVKENNPVSWVQLATSRNMAPLCLICKALGQEEEEMEKFG